MQNKQAILSGDSDDDFDTWMEMLKVVPEDRKKISKRTNMTRSHSINTLVVEEDTDDGKWVEFSEIPLVQWHNSDSRLLFAACPDDMNGSFTLDMTPISPRKRVEHKDIQVPALLPACDASHPVKDLVKDDKKPPMLETFLRKYERKQEVVQDKKDKTKVIRVRLRDDQQVKKDQTDLERRREHCLQLLNMTDTDTKRFNSKKQEKARRRQSLNDDGQNIESDCDISHVACIIPQVIERRGPMTSQRRSTNPRMCRRASCGGQGESWRGRIFVPQASPSLT